MHREWVAVLVVSTVILTACPKQAPGGGKGTQLAVSTRTPIQCSRVQKEERADTAETFKPTGCNASVRFSLSPSGSRDVDLPFFRDSTQATTIDTLRDGIVSGQAVVLRDPGGERSWEVVLPATSMPWAEAGRCAHGTDPTAFDLSAWRFLVVRVETRDTYGTTRPLTEVQRDTLRLTLTPDGSEAFRPTLVPSQSHDGVWAAAWCADVEGAMDVELDVRGAYQLEVDRFRLPALDADVYSTLSYVVEPIEVDEAL